MHPAALTPHAQVDQVVLRAIAARSRMRLSDSRQAMHSHRRLRTYRFLWLIGQVAVVVILLLTLSALHFLGGPTATPRAISLPANLSWSGYVLFYRETKVGMNGVHYSVNCYHDLSTGRMHVETMAGSGLDIVAVGEEQALLGTDLIHHIVQSGAYTWNVDCFMLNPVH